MMISEFCSRRTCRFVLFLLLFCFVAASVIFDWSWAAAADGLIQRAVFALRSDLLTAILIPLTYSGNWQVVTGLCVFLLILPSTRKWFGIPMTASAVTSVAVYELLKYLIRRPRPDVSLHLIQQGGFSFPSGHTLSSIMVWGTFLLLILHYHRNAYNRPLQAQQIGPAARFSTAIMHRPCPGDGLTLAMTAFAAGYIVLMGLSRIYLGVHWPTDVLASWCLGLALLSPIGALVGRIR